MTLRLSDELQTLVDQFDDRQLTIKEIAALFPARIQALLVLFLSLPFIFFLPIPGLSIIFGIFIALNGLKIATKNELTFPRFLLKRKISGKTLRKTLLLSEKILKKLEKWVKPRGAYLHAKPWIKKANGCVLIVCGVLMALPVPNLPAALTCALFSLGILEEDGVVIGIGYFCFLVTLAFYITILFLGYEGIEQLWSSSP